MSSAALRRGLRIWLYTTLIIVSLIMILPFIWGILSSFKSSEELFSIPPTLFPKELILDNYRQVVTTGFFLRDNMNSLIIAVFTTVGTVLLCSITGYTLAKFKFRGRDQIFLLFLGTMMIPVQVTMIPVFILTTKLGLINTHMGIILPMIANAYGVFLMRQFMMTLPNEMIEAARIDGCHEFKIFAKIAMPLAKPAVGTLTILTFMDSWNQFLWPLILLNSSEMATVQLGLRRFQSEYSAKYNLIMAAAVLAIIPIAIVFVLFQEYIVEGISMGGVKE